MSALRHLTKKLINTINKDGKLQINNSCSICIRFLNYNTKEYDEARNPSPVFFNPEIQTLLKTLTRVDLPKVFKRRKLGEKRLQDPTYKFLTTEQLNELMEDAVRKADAMLQIPPIVAVRKPINRILSKDPALTGLDENRLVFTDISFGVKNSQRIIVVRETDGTLRKADWELRDRVNQVYFPQVGRSISAAKLFQENFLEGLLERHEYEFVLDAACMQYEPDDSEYQRVVSITYQHINDNNEFEKLRSTRHFGALTFFLTWHKEIDNLLLELLQTLQLEEANTLLELYSKVNNVAIQSDGKFAGIENFVRRYATKRGALELALQSCKEFIKEREELEAGIEVAHGINS